MDQYELLENVQNLLRKAIATRLKIAKTEYDGSFDAQAAVNRLLTNVMSIGYNHGSTGAVVEELCTARHFGDEGNEAVITAMRKEIIGTENTLRHEIAAFAKIHEQNQLGAAPAATWVLIQSMIILGDDYAP